MIRRDELLPHGEDDTGWLSMFRRWPELVAFSKGHITEEEFHELVLLDLLCPKRMRVLGQ